MPEGPHLCMQMTKLKHAKIKHAEERGKKKHAGRTASLDYEQDQHLAGSVCVCVECSRPTEESN